MKSLGIFTGAAAAVGLALGASGAARADCQLGLIAELPVVVDHNQVFAKAEINGQPVNIQVDTGSVKTMLWRGPAEGLGLHSTPMEDDDGSSVTFVGVGGGQDARITTVRDLKLGSATAHNVRLIVLGAPGAVKSARSVGLLGADLLLHDDLELDLAHGVLRLMRPKGCHGDEVVYWNKPYSTATIVPTNSGQALDISVALNGKTIDAEMDTGSQNTIVTERAARSVGVTPRSEGVKAKGVVGGIGGEPVKVYSAIFATLSIGDEKIENAKVELGQIFEADKQVPLGSHIATEQAFDAPEMLLGADFMMAHRIYIARSQGKVYFSYNGGPIFDIEHTTEEKTAEAPKPPAPTPTPTPTPTHP